MHNHRQRDPASDEGIESYEGRRVNDTSPERVTSREESIERPSRSDEDDRTVAAASQQQEVDMGYELRRRMCSDTVTIGQFVFDSFWKFIWHN